MELVEDDKILCSEALESDDVSVAEYALSSSKERAVEFHANVWRLMWFQSEADTSGSVSLQLVPRHCRGSQDAVKVGSSAGGSSDGGRSCSCCGSPDHILKSCPFAARLKQIVSILLRSEAELARVSLRNNMLDLAERVAPTRAVNLDEDALAEAMANACRKTTEMIRKVLSKASLLDGPEIKTMAAARAIGMDDDFIRGIIDADCALDGSE